MRAENSSSRELLARGLTAQVFDHRLPVMDDRPLPWSV
jgi:hypothetical protein